MVNPRDIAGERKKKKKKKKDRDGSTARSYSDFFDEDLTALKGR